MSEYILGGWAQSLADTPPAGFSHTMYGMVTNLAGLTTGTETAPGWSPTNNKAPKIPGNDVLWTYGGGLCSPESMPKTSQQISDIVAAAKDNDWAGVDFDDECNMNIDNLIDTMQQLKPLQTSYTFIAGWAYNNPNASSNGQAINDAVKKISNAGAADRFALMCYATEMWSKADIEANVSQAIERTINDNGVTAKSVILALTPEGLDDWNLNYFLDQVLKYDIGGVYVWNFPLLKGADLDVIKDRLGI